MWNQLNSEDPQCGALTSPVDVRAWYNTREPVWNEALERLKEALADLTYDAGEYREYRPKITGRVKGFARLLKKMQTRHIPVNNPEQDIYDIVGARVICHSLEDVYRAVNAIHSRGSEYNLEVEETDDKINVPAPSGYRSVHLRCSFNPDGGEREFQEIASRVAPDKGADETGFILHGRFVSTGKRSREFLPEIKCEVQVRTEIQDSWATLSHADLYEEYEKMPPQLTRIYAHLAEVMSGVDKIVGEIRHEAVDVKYPDFIPPAYTEPVDVDGLKRVFKKVYGKDAEEEVACEALEILIERGISEISPVEQALLKKSVREVIDLAYDYLVEEAPDEDDYFLGTLYLIDSPDSEYLENHIGQRYGIALSEYWCTGCLHRMTSDDEQRWMDEVGEDDTYCSKCIDEVLVDCPACGGAVKISENNHGFCNACEERIRRE